MKLLELRHLNKLGGMLAYTTFASILGLMAFNQSIFPAKTTKTSNTTPSVLGAIIEEEIPEPLESGLEEGYVINKGGQILKLETQATEEIQSDIYSNKGKSYDNVPTTSPEI